VEVLGGSGRQRARGRRGRGMEWEARPERESGGEELATRDARIARAHRGYSPPHRAGSKGGAGGSFVQSTFSCRESTTVTPSGKARSFPIWTGACGWPAASNRTIDMLPQRVSKVTGSRFSSE